MTKLGNSVLRRIRQRITPLKNSWPKNIVVQTPNGPVTISATSEIEKWRAESLLTKETGTVAWINRSVKPGDIVLDIGANIGVYSLLAALRVGHSGRVYSIEPHLLNCVSLMRNVACNSFGSRIMPMCIALHNDAKLLPFNYRSLIPGTSMSQLNRLIDGENIQFAPEAVEWKIAMTVDSMIDTGLLPPPALVKIDVDGNEPLILEGMQKLLSGPSAPRELQVEVNQDCEARINELMNSCSFKLLERHDTSGGLAKIASGSVPAEVAHNLIFRNTK